jgi:Xaa-Pro aminopeptidase
MVEHARPGVPEREVFAHMAFEQLRRGSEIYHIAWKGAVWGEPAARMLGAPEGIIRTGWFIENEIVATVNNYGCQICQPVCVGPAPAAATEAFKLGKAAFERATEIMRPGVTWGEVEREVRAVAKGTGYDVHLLIHGRGLFQYTPWAIGGDGPLLIPTDTHEHMRDQPIKANTTFVLKPYAYAVDTSAGELPRVTWGDSVVVREHGVERLGTRAHELISV